MPYFDELRNLSLPLYIRYIPDNKVVIIKGREERKRKGKGRTLQTYYHIEDGIIRHGSKFQKLNIKSLLRKEKLNKIL